MIKIRNWRARTSTIPLLFTAVVAPMRPPDPRNLAPESRGRRSAGRVLGASSQTFNDINKGQFSLVAMHTVLLLSIHPSSLPDGRAARVTRVQWKSFMRI